MIREEAGRRATWWIAAPGGAAPRSSCAATSRPTRCPAAASGSPTTSELDRDRRREWRAGVSARPQRGARRVRPLRAARRPRRLPPGAAGAHARRGSDRARSRCCGWAARAGRDPRRSRVALRPRSRSAASWSSTTTGTRLAGPRSTTSARERGVVDPLERVGWDGAVWRKTTEPDGAGRRRPPSRRARAAASARAGRPSNRHQGPIRGRRLLQHAPRGDSDPALALPRLPAGSRGPRLRGDRRSRTARTPDQRLGEELVRSFGPEFRYIDLGDDAAPSPARARQSRASPHPRVERWR